MSLTKCIKTAGKSLDQYDADTILELRDRMVADGMGQKEAGIEAVRLHLDDVMAERQAIVEQVQAQGGAAPDAPVAAAMAQPADDGVASQTATTGAATRDPATQQKRDGTATSAQDSAAVRNDRADAERRLSDGDAARARAQASENRRFARDPKGPAPINFGRPSPGADAAVGEVAQLLESQLGGRLFAFNDPAPDSMQGVAIGGDAFVNTAPVDAPMMSTALHEFTHTVEQIALAEMRAGIVGSPAQTFQDQMDQLFDLMTEDGKRAYLENYLRYDELRAIKDPVAREAALQEFMNDGLIRAEMTADFMGNRAMDPEFWADLAAADPTGFDAFVKKWLTLLKNMISTLKGSPLFGRTESAKVDQYVTDMEAAKQIAQDALIEYSRSQRETLPDDSDGARFSRRQVGGFSVKTAKDGSIVVEGDSEAIRALLPEGVRGRSADGGLAFTPNAAHRVVSALEGDRQTYSRAGEVHARHPMKDGKYVGAPENFNTPAKIPTLRKILMKLTKEGVDGRYWYENSSEAVMRFVGGDKAEARKFVALLAIYSPQAKVDTNSTFAIRAWAQYKAGKPISVKTKVMDKKAQNALDNIDEFWSGEKTGNFFQNLLGQIDESTAGKQGATIDMWMMRAAQYKNDAPTTSQYRFMEVETNRIAQELGWEPQQVQAAIWVAMKARMENSGVKKRTEAKSEKRGWITYVSNNKGAKIRKILDAKQHRDNWLKHAMDHDPTANDTKQAKFDFEDGLYRHVGLISFESRPGRTTGVLPGIHNASYEQQLEFHSAIHKAMHDASGRDLIAHYLGLMVEGDITAPGIWQGEVSPSSQSTAVMAPSKGSAGKKSVDPAQSKLLDLYAAMAGLIGRQEGVGWHRPFYKAKKGDHNGVELRIGRPLTPDEAQQLWTSFDALMREKGFPDWEKKAALISSPVGMRVINYGIMDNSEFRKAAARAAESMDQSLTIDPVYFASDGTLVENNWQENPNGEGFARQISGAGRSDLLDWGRDVLAPKIQRVYEEFSERHGWGDPGELRFSRRQRDGRGSDSGRAEAPLPGAPVKQGATGPDPALVEVARSYAAANGISLRRQAEYVNIDPGLAGRIASAYEAMKHAPRSPVVRASYAEMIRQTRAQYDALVAAGYQFTFFDSSTDPYGGNPWNAMRDLRKNKSMAVYGTYDGYGTDGITGAQIKDNPMLEDTGLRWTDQGGVERPVTANDLFRAVHDAFGHGLEGAGFRDRGEENAWQAHSRLFTGRALGALTSETRGQNSWLNYGPHGETNRTASLEDTVFAEQKVGLLPEWAWTEGLAADETPAFSKRQTTTPEFKRWFGNSKVVDENGEPLVVYHGTRADFGEFSSDFFGDGVGGEAREGFFFTNDPEEASGYAAGTEPGGRVIPVYVSLKNPVDVPFSEHGISDIIEADSAVADYLRRARGVVSRLRGKDGLILRDIGGDPQRSLFIAFRPEQIKSAIGNRGTFDPADPDIRRSKRQTETPAFRRWFGDSKVVDGNGEPLVVYHGTRADFAVFDRLASKEWRPASMDTVGSWFSSSPDKAARYAGADGRNVMPVYLSIKNPKIYRQFDDFLREMHEAEGRRLEDQNPKGVGSAEGLRTKLKSEGYDGIQFEQTDNESLYQDIREAQEAIRRAKDDEFGVARAERAPYTKKRERLESTLRAMNAELKKMGGSTEFDGQDVFVAFDPEQIKSATGNRGTFDPADPDIRRSKRQTETPAFRRWYRSELAEVAQDLPKIASKEGTVKPVQAVMWLRSQQQKGRLKAEELEWSGVTDWLQSQDGDVAVSDIQSFIDSHGVQVEEVQLGGLGSFNAKKKAQELHDMSPEELKEEYEEVTGDDTDGWDFGYADRDQVIYNLMQAYREEAGAPRGDDGDPKYESNKVPGGENYREMLLTLPNKATSQEAEAAQERLDASGLDDAFRRGTQEQIDRMRREAQARAEYRSSHWDQPNVLAHVRVDDRTDAEGNRVLFVNEIQSDWGQAGRKMGFIKGSLADQPMIAEINLSANKPYWEVRTESGVFVANVVDVPVRDGTEQEAIDAARRIVRARVIPFTVPSAPFVTKTENWTALALKRIIAMAAEGGYDKVAIVNGKQASKMFNLGDQIKGIEYEPAGDGLYDVVAKDIHGDGVFEESGMGAERIADVFGKDVADQIASNAGTLVYPPDSFFAEYGARERAAQEVPGLSNDLAATIAREYMNSEDRTWESYERNLRQARGLGGPWQGAPSIYQAYDAGILRSAWVAMEQATVPESLVRTLSLDGISPGTPGMMGFYDKIVPATLGKVLKKVGGGQVEQVALDAGDQVGFTITDAMRNAVQEGLPLFSRRQLRYTDDEATSRDRSTTEAAPGRSAPSDPRTDPGSSREEIGYGDFFRQTETPAFRRLFGDSKVVDESGEPLVVYRGEYGEGGPQLRTRLGSITFVDDPEVASTYATNPNDFSKRADSPRVYPAYLSITNPVIENRDDPFIDFSDLAGKLGEAEAARFAKKYADRIESTDNWYENFSGKYRSVSALLSASPESINQLYIDAYLLLDDAEFVASAQSAGFDGAFHIGNGVSRDALEFRVFSAAQVIPSIGNQGPFDPTNPDIRRSRRQTATPAFRRWFSGSAVVDADGNPKIVYHGTTGDFTQFQTPSYFAENSDEASAYTFSAGLAAAERSRARHRLGKPVDGMAGKRVSYTGTLSDFAQSERKGVVATDHGVYQYGKDGKPEFVPNLVVNYDAPFVRNKVELMEGDGTAAFKEWQQQVEEMIANRDMDKGRGGNVMPVYLSIKNPLDLHPLEANRLGARLKTMSPAQVEAQIAKWEADGYDGIKTTSDEAFVAPDLFDGKVLGQWVAFRPEQIKSATGNSGAFDPANPDIRYSRAQRPVDPREEMNRRIREEHHGVWYKAKTATQRYFAPGGLLPKPVFAAKIQRDSSMGASELNVSFHVTAVENAFRRDFGKSYEKRTRAEEAMMSEALAGRPSAQLPQATATAIEAMRQHIDQMSGRYVDILREDGQRLLSGLTADQQLDLLDRIDRDDFEGLSRTEAQIVQKLQLMQTIENNVGEYVHRSYKAFDDPLWPRNVPSPVLNAARDYLEARHIQANPGATTDEAQRAAQRVMNDILKQGTAYDSMEAYIRESKLGAKDLSLLKQRKQIAPEIRALLGEHQDPRINFAKSATKMSRLIHNDTFLKRVRDVGMGVFLFEDGQQPEDGYTATLAAEGNESYAPLNGLRTTPEINQAFIDALGKEQLGPVFRRIVQLNGAVKFGKTVLSPTTAMRNFYSAYFFTMANGHFDMSHARKSLAAHRKHNTDENWRQYFSKLKELGVIYDTPYAEEMMRLLRDAEVANRLLDGRGAGRMILDKAQAFYRFGDDFWKVIGFENEVALQMKHRNLSRADAEIMAGERIRNTYPTYSMTGKFVNHLRRFPLAGTFVSFPAEIIRTTFNMLRYTAEDMRHSKALGARRLVGLSMVAASAYAAQALSKYLLDVDDDEEEAVRNQAPPWSQNSNMLFMSREDGNLRYLDLSFLDPYNYWKRPITALTRDDIDLKDAAVTAAGEMLAPFFGVDIAFGAITEIWTNKKGTGGRVYNEADTPLEQTYAIADHLRKAVQPGAFANLERILKAAKDERTTTGRQYTMDDEMAALAGFRVSTLDPKVSLRYRTFDATSRLRDATSIISTAARNPNPVTDKELRKTFDRVAGIRSDVYGDLLKSIKSARKSGLDPQGVIRQLESGGVSKKDARMLAQGIMPPKLSSNQYLQSAVKAAGDTFGPEVQKEINRRRLLILQWERESARQQRRTGTAAE